MTKFIDPGVKITVFGAGEMAYQLRSWTTLAENPNWIPSTHTRWLTTTCNRNSKGSDTWPPQTPAFMCAYPHRDTQTYT